MKTALSIAGSDSSAGAGIQADIKAMTMNGVYATTAITALTAQNTTGVRAPQFLAQQIDAVFEDIRPDAVKIGMISSPELVNTIAERLHFYHAQNIVVDPVVVATSGSVLARSEAVSLLKSVLLPMATVITPNIPEAQLLSGIEIHSSQQMQQAARIISEECGCAVLCKGGHSISDANDLLYADGETRVTEPYISRDHSERMLSAFGADIHTEGTTAILQPAKQLYGQKILVPGDISSAAFFIAAGLIVPDSEILIKNVGINPTRDGILRVCKAMNADVELLNVNTTSGEPTADLLVRSGKLTGTAIEGAIIPTLIDELPVIAAMACYAEGTTVIRDAAELKVKESNRIAVMVENLTAMGADVTETEDGMIIHGGKPLHGAVIDSKKDHRIAMTFAVAALGASGETEILDADCVNISYPGFYGDLERLCK